MPTWRQQIIWPGIKKLYLIPLNWPTKISIINSSGLFKAEFALDRNQIAKSLLHPHYLTWTSLGIPALLLEKLGRSIKCAYYCIIPVSYYTNFYYAAKWPCATKRLYARTVACSIVPPYVTSVAMPCFPFFSISDLEYKILNTGISDHNSIQCNNNAETSIRDNEYFYPKQLCNLMSK